MLPLVALALAVTSQVTAADPAYKVVCYYQSWSVYRPETGAFNVEDIDPGLCTHHLYAFAGLNSSNMIDSLDPFNDLYDNNGKGGFLRFTGMKDTHPDIKTMLSIGGWNEGSKKYSQMAASPETRATFANSVVEMLTRYKFDGLDMDWEYPTQREGASPDDKANFILLLKDLSEAMWPQGLILSAALSAGKEVIDDAYDLSQVADYVDFLNIMSFDYHGDWDLYVMHDAPLYISQKDIEHGEPQIWNDVNFTMNYYLQHGIAPSKLLMALPLYGRGFILTDPAKHEPYDLTDGPMDACPYSAQAGFCDYNELCSMTFKEGGWTDVFDNEMQATYSYKDNLWIGWDSEQGIQVKLDYLKSIGIAGTTIWSIDTDDFGGVCGNPYPMLNKIWSELNGA